MIDVFVVYRKIVNLGQLHTLYKSVGESATRETYDEAITACISWWQTGVVHNPGAGVCSSQPGEQLDMLIAVVTEDYQIRSDR